MGETRSTLKRSKHPMPDSVRDALNDRGLMDAYMERPPYQRNDYLGWIARAKREATQQKRLEQMLEELAIGDVYMKMSWTPPDRRRPPASTKE